MQKGILNIEFSAYGHPNGEIILVVVASVEALAEFQWFCLTFDSLFALWRAFA